MVFDYIIISIVVDAPRPLASNLYWLIMIIIIDNDPHLSEKLSSWSYCQSHCQSDDVPNSYQPPRTLPDTLATDRGVNNLPWFYRVVSDLYFT